jgi:hypothetical protein
MYYEKLMKDWLFTKNGNNDKKFAIGGLGYRSEYTLKSVSRLNVGDGWKHPNGYTLRRIQ